jgi:dipeptidyl-peptidase-4
VEVVNQIEHIGADGKHYLVVHGDLFDGITRLAPWIGFLGDKAYDFVLMLNGKFNWIRHRMGRIEVQDQGDGVRWLVSQGLADAARVGIYGWSYGGYMSSLCLAVGADIFKMAISVAPVANWRYYDSIYTERYMGLPKDNGKGYDAFSPTSNMQKIKGKLLLVHGTADDNVHYQNSVEMVNALVKNNVQFDFFMFPDKNHSIYGGNTRLYLFTKMTDYIKANL